MVQCGICLEQLKLPVVIPCGHLHCERCLTSHIEAGRDAMHSSCPTCRAKFNIASLDLRYVPKKYHEFIKPSVQRVWIDIPSQEGLKSRISELEKSLAVVHRDKQLLLEKCEQNLDAIRHHAEGERNARAEAEKAKKDMEKAKKDAEKAKKDAEKAKKEASQVSKQLALLKIQQKRRRTMGDEALVQTTGDITASTSASTSSNMLRGIGSKRPLRDMSLDFPPFNDVHPANLREKRRRITEPLESLEPITIDSMPPHRRTIQIPHIHDYLVELDAS